MCVVVPRASWQGRPLRSPVASLWPWRGNRHRAFPRQWGDFRSPQTPSTQHTGVCSGKAEGACLPLGTQPPPARQGSVPAPLDPMTISSKPNVRRLDAQQGLGDVPLHPAPEPRSNRLAVASLGFALSCRSSFRNDGILCGEMDQFSLGGLCIHWVHSPPCRGKMSVCASAWKKPFVMNSWVSAMRRTVLPRR